jgi:hypothetical protein
MMNPSKEEKHHATCRSPTRRNGQSGTKLEAPWRDGDQIVGPQHADAGIPMTAARGEPEFGADIFDPDGAALRRDGPKNVLGRGGQGGQPHVEQLAACARRLLARYAGFFKGRLGRLDPAVAVDHKAAFNQNLSTRGTWRAA